MQPTRVRSDYNRFDPYFDLLFLGLVGVGLWKAIRIMTK